MFQRYMHATVAMVTALSVGLSKQPRFALFICLMASFAGGAVAAYKVGIEKNWWGKAVGCHSVDTTESVDTLITQLASSELPCDIVQ